MKKLLLVLAVTAAVYIGLDQRGRALPEPAVVPSQAVDQVLASAFENHTRNLAVEGEGIVTRILSDDADVARHQRFIIQLTSGQTVLVAHNIDLASRIAALDVGDTVWFKGEYEWNAKGGVIHWTHHDPEGRRSGGWIKHAGQTYR
jgi:hypothetical protein